MKLMRNAIVAGFVAAAAAVVACSGQTSGTNGNSKPGSVGNTAGNAGGLGQVDSTLLLNGSGDALQSINWTISGGPGGTYTGTDQIGDAQAISFTASGILAGCGYNLSVTGTDTNGDPCSGSTTTSFCVSTDPTGTISTDVSLVITCIVPADAATAADVQTGQVSASATAVLDAQAAFSCPGISAFSVSPAALLGTQLAQLSISEIGTPGTIAWTATPCSNSAGVITGFLGADGGPDTTDPSVSFSCGSCTGTTTVTAQVENFQVPITGGPAVNVCNGVAFTTISQTITCEGGGVQTCLSPTTNCATDGGTDCINVNANPPNASNCGGCGVTCPTGSTCTFANGVDSCVTPTAVPCTGNTGTTISAATLTPSGCVPCDQNTNGVCSNTEAVLVQRDIIKGNVTGTTLKSATGSCYECMVAQGSLDSSVQGFSGLECDDLTGTAVQSCLNTLNCIVGSPQNPSGTVGTAGTANPAATKTTLPTDCSNDQPPTGDGVFNCFCGSAEPNTSSCGTADSLATANTTGGLGVASPNGVCAALTVAGLGTDTSSTANSKIITDLSNSTLGSGEAYTILQNAGTNLTGSEPCLVCYQ